MSSVLIKHVNDRGIGVSENTIAGIARGKSFVRGEIGMVDFDRSNSSNNLIGDPQSVFANIVAVSSDGEQSARIMAIALEDISQNKEGIFMLQGVTNLLVTDAHKFMQVGKRIGAASTGGVIGNALVNGDRIFGISTASGDGFLSCLWDGVYGHSVTVIVPPDIPPPVGLDCDFDEDWNSDPDSDRWDEVGNWFASSGNLNIQSNHPNLGLFFPDATLTSTEDECQYTDVQICAVMGPITGDDLLGLGVRLEMEPGGLGIRNGVWVEVSDDRIFIYSTINSSTQLLISLVSPNALPSFVQGDEICLIISGTELTIRHNMTFEFQVDLAGSIVTSPGSVGVIFDNSTVPKTATWTIDRLEVLEDII